MTAIVTVTFGSGFKSHKHDTVRDGKRIERQRMLERIRIGRNTVSEQRIYHHLFSIGCQLITHIDSKSCDFHIQLFGPFDLKIDGKPFEITHSRKEQWLLALLILKNGKEVTRDWLAGTLWPDSQEEQALAYLRRTLYLLRQSLGSAAVRLQSPTSRTLRIDLTGAYSDVSIFDDSVRNGDFEALSNAVDLYRGPLLEGCDEEWAVAEQQTREQMFLSALELLAEKAIESGKAGAAIPHLQRLVILDSLRESAHRMLMQALADDGDYGEMVQAYRRLRLTLRQQVQQNPSPETVALYEKLKTRAQQRIKSAPSAEAEVKSIDKNPVSKRSADTSRKSGSKAPAVRPLTPLIGREVEMQDIIDLLHSSSLVTLTGTGGVGKTRMSMQLAQDWQADDVWFVELASLTAATPLGQVVAHAIGMTDAAGSTMPDSLVEELSDSSGLLILDNCEHLLDAAAALVLRLLRGCPDLHILATSRQALGILGEAAYSIPPLETPEISNTGDTSAEIAGAELMPILLEYPSVQLFIQRAQNASPGFKLTRENGVAVANICAALDGIPLAIELAAARMKTLSPQQIFYRLGDRFRLLTSVNRAEVPHHQTLRALVDWSYDVLATDVQLVLQRLSVFSGGWPLDLAEAICSDDDSDNPLIKSADILDHLTTLIDQSLVQVEAGQTGPRYRLLETIRQYADEKLVASGAYVAQRSRHCEKMLPFMQPLVDGLKGTKLKECLQRFEEEHDNLRSALEWSLSGNVSPELALQLCGKMNNFWVFRGYYREGQRWCEKALARTSETERTEVRAQAIVTGGTMLWMLGDFRNAYVRFQNALSIRREIGNKRAIAISLDRLGAVAQRMGAYDDAIHFLEESVSLAREIDDIGAITSGLINLGCAEDENGNAARALEVWDEALALTQISNNKIHEALALANLGTLEERDGNLEKARTHYLRGLEIMQDAGDRGGIAVMLNNLGTVAEAMGEYETAKNYEKQALRDWIE
ncbi:MAG: tetratricopeptide repeat protein [Chthonomonadales bacterium]